MIDAGGEPDVVMACAGDVPTIRAAHVRQLMRDKRTEHRAYIAQRGEDMPEVRDWAWGHDENRSH